MIFIMIYYDEIAQTCQVVMTLNRYLPCICCMSLLQLLVLPLLLLLLLLWPLSRQGRVSRKYRFMKLGMMKYRHDDEY